MNRKKPGILKNYSRMEIKKFPYVALFLILPLINFCVFYVYVNLDSFRLAFTDNLTGEFTLEHFRIVFERFFGEQGYLRERLFRSMIVWIFSTFITFPVSILFSYAIFKKIPFANTIKVIFMLPVLLGTVIMAGIYKNMLGSTGPILSLLKAIGVHLPEVILNNGLFANSKTAYIMLLIYQFWLGMGTNIMLLSGAMARVPQDVLEAAKLDGVGFFREFAQIVMPLVYPTIVTMIILSMSSLLVADAGTFVFFAGSNPEGVATLGYEMTLLTYIIAQTGSKAYGYPAALGMVTSAVTIPITLLTRRWLEKHMEGLEY